MTKRLRRLPGYAFLTVFGIFSVFPLYFMVVSATNTSAEVLSSKLVPGTHFFDNVAVLFQTQNVVGAMWSSAA
ncbi:hypothetical protein ACJBV7_10760, partial [Streptococcus suis]